MPKYTHALPLAFGCVLGLMASHANADGAAEMLGRVFGSLDCTTITNPDEKQTCSARALSSGSGCSSLSSSTMRNKCKDERLFPRVHHKPYTRADVSWPPKETQRAAAPPAPLSDQDYQRIEGELLGRQATSSIQATSGN